MRLAARVGLALALVPAGGVVGLCAAVLSSLWWGILLGLGATVACVVALAPGWRGRLPFCLGWAVVVARLAVRRPEGDYVVAADPGGYLLLGAGLALVVAAMVSVPPRRGTGPGARTGAGAGAGLSPGP